MRTSPIARARKIPAHDVEFADAPRRSACISPRRPAQDLWEGEAAVHALRGVDLTIARRRAAGAARAVGVRQVDPAERARRAGPADLRQLFFPRHGPCERRGRRRHAVSARCTSGFVFQFYNLIASLTAQENVELVTEVATGSDARRGSARAGRARQAAASLPGAAVRRRAAACRDRARDRQATDRIAV